MLGVVATSEDVVLGVLRATLEAEEAVLQPALWLGLEATLVADLVRDALTWEDAMLELTWMLGEGATLGAEPAVIPAD